MTVPQTPSWPNGDNGRVLLHFTADCSVDALWEDFFGSYPELQVGGHDFCRGAKQLNAIMLSPRSR